MDASLMLDKESNNRKKSIITSIILHLLLLLLLLFPILNYQDPPPEQQGVLVSFGMPEQGDGAERAESNKDSRADFSESDDVEKESSQANQANTKSPDENTQQEVEELKTSDDSETARLEAQKKAQADARAEQERLEAKRKADAEAEARRKAEAEAKKQQEYDQAKSKFGSMFEKGKGESGNTGNEGDPSGSPDASVLEGLSTGSGRIGGGLSNRGVVYEPDFNDDSQKTGKVVVKICVDNNGNVIGTPKYTQKGSTTSDAQLIESAIRDAKKYQFSASEIDKQCGTVTIDFKLK